MRAGGSSNLTTMPTIAPYQDPEFGERPTYQRRGSSSRTKEFVQNQDEIMMDAYAYDGPTEGEEGGAPIPEDGDA